MRKSILWFVLLTLFEIPYVLAQNGFRVTGQIISADDNQPVIGVSIIEKGTTNGVITGQRIFPVGKLSFKRIA